MRFIEDSFEIKEDTFHKEALLQLMEKGSLQSHIYFDCKPSVEQNKGEGEQLDCLILVWRCHLPAVIHFIVHTRFTIDFSGEGAPKGQISWAIHHGLDQYVSLFNEQHAGIDLRRIIPGLDKASLFSLRRAILLLLINDI